MTIITAAMDLDPLGPIRPHQPGPVACAVKRIYRAIWPGDPGGYVCTAADDVVKKGKVGRAAVDWNAVAVKSRETAIERGHTGTITSGLSGVPVKGDVSKARVGRKREKA